MKIRLLGIELITLSVLIGVYIFMIQNNINISQYIQLIAPELRGLVKILGIAILFLIGFIGIILLVAGDSSSINDGYD